MINNKKYSPISLKEFSEGFNHARFIYKNSIPPYNLYDESQIEGIAENIIFLQNPDGGWAKNIDYQRIFTLEELKDIKKKTEVSKQCIEYPNLTQSTLDNNNIFSQIRYLANVYMQIPENRYIESAKRGILWILNAQEPKTGGFTGSDCFAITFNDNVMVNTLCLLNDIVKNQKLYSFVDEQTRTLAKNAYYRGIDCILKTQIKVTLDNGYKILTAWCQQHSYENYAPVWAREFEPPSICSTESKNVVKFLMKIKNPSHEIQNAIISACEFFERPELRICGKKLVKKPHNAEIMNGRYYNYEQVLVDDPSAPDLWARFYALDSSFDVKIGSRKTIQGTYPSVLKPIWCDRQYKYVKDFNSISVERRNGYAYTTSSIKSLISIDFPEWKKKNGIIN